MRVAETPLSIEKLSTLVATHERKISERDDNSTFEEEVYASLYHKHIPLMTEADAIDKTSQEEVLPGEYFDENILLLGDQGVTI